MPSVMYRAFTSLLQVQGGNVIVEDGGIFVSGDLACIGDKCDSKKAYKVLFDRNNRKSCPLFTTAKPKTTKPQKTTPKKPTPGKGDVCYASVCGPTRLGILMPHSTNTTMSFCALSTPTNTTETCLEI